LLLLLQKSKSLYMLWPDGTCRQLGLQAAVNTSLITALQAMVNASNTPMAAALLNSRISSLSSSAAGSNSAAMAQVRWHTHRHPTSWPCTVSMWLQQLGLLP
jgi:hypothetical protein